MAVRSDYCIKEFKNGNISIKYDKDAIENSKKDKWLTLSNILSQLDCELIGEPFSFGNFDMAYRVYNAHIDRVYTLSMRELDDLEAGKTVRLYAAKPDEDDREIIEKCA